MGTLLHHGGPGSLTALSSFLPRPALSSPLTVLNAVLKVKSQGLWGELRVVGFLGKRIEDKELGTNLLNVQGLPPRAGILISSRAR